MACSDLSDAKFDVINEDQSDIIIYINDFSESTKKFDFIIYADDINLIEYHQLIQQ